MKCPIRKVVAVIKDAREVAKASKLAATFNMGYKRVGVTSTTKKLGTMLGKAWAWFGPRCP